MKHTAVAPSNIAFIKYWGVKDEVLRLPKNPSISMNLDNLLTTTTVEFDTKYTKDEIIIDEEKNPDEIDRVTKHLDRIRNLAKISTFAKVVSKNNFPRSTGLSSSASGFAALTLAGAKGADLELSEKELTILARLGSGSACRSIPDGFVEWVDGNSETSFAVSLYPSEYWDIADVVAITGKGKKEVSSSEGHKLAATSPFFEKRLELNKEKIKNIKKYLEEKNFNAFGELIEEEALELHAIYITSHPSLIYLLPESLEIMKNVKKWRNEGLEAYFTVNTGQDVHIICQQKDETKVAELLEKIGCVEKLIINHPAKGARIIQDHLF